jgi:hypothetical protein
LEVRLHTAAVPPPAANLQLRRRDPTGDLLGRPVVTQHIGIAQMRRDPGLLRVSMIACLAGFGDPSVTNSGASADSSRPLSSGCQSG